MKHLQFLVFSSLIIFLSSCLPELEKDYDGVNFDFSNSDIQSVFRLANSNSLDSLALLVNDKNPAVRKSVAMIAADGQKRDLLPLLYKLVEDTDAKVSATAAYAIGQYNDTSSRNILLKAYDPFDTLRIKQNHNACVLEAFGKIGNDNDLNNVINIKSFRTKDTILQLGQLRALQHFSKRKMLNEKALELLLNKVQDENLPTATRVLAANIIGNDKKIDITKYEQRLFNIFKESNNPLIKMAVVKPLKGTLNTVIQKGIIETLGQYDSRVTVNTLKTIADFPYILTINKVVPLISNPNQQVALSAVEYIKNNGLTGSKADIYRQYLSGNATPSTKIALRGAILNRLPKGFSKSRGFYNKQLQSFITDSTNVTYAVDATKQLANDPENYRFLLSQIKPTNTLVSSAAAESINTILTSEKLQQYYRGRTEKVKKEIVDSLIAKIKIPNEGVTSIIGNIFANENLNLKTYLGDGKLLKETADQLELPKNLEPYDALNKAYAYVSNTKYEPKKYKAKAINWELLNKVGSKVKAEFVTNKGSFTAELYPERAPQSVSNFIELANDGYYNNKKVHRVVPNFVIQSGCSNGDGYSSLDYTINSEVSQSYYEDEGYLGMASLGYNTESSQWFVTHSPAIHLSGRYTVFGKIISGMDKVIDTEVGDTIKEIIIKK